MKNTGGAIDFEAYLKTQQFDSAVKKIRGDISGLTGHVAKEADQMNRTFTQLGRLAAGAFAGLQLSSTVQEIVRVRGEFQQLEISLTTMLGSKAKADKLMADIVQTAATTPFGMKDLSSGVKQLIAYGSTAEGVMKEIRMLGDVAAGTSTPINDLIYLYGTLRTQGRAYAVDIRQFAGRGIPIYQELAKVMKVNVDEVNNLVESGKVGFAQVEQAFKSMTAAGSMFGGLTDAQSKSLKGLQERLSDAIDIMFNDIGKKNEGLIAEVFKGAATAVEHYQEVIDVLKVVVAAYGAYRAALMLTAAYQNRANIAALINGYIELAKGLRNAAAAQALFNRVTLANPFVLAATALGALVAGYVVYNKEADEATRLTERISDSINAETSKVQALTSQVNDQNLSQSHRAEKLKELIALSPDHLKGLNLENMATAEGSKLIDDYVESLSKKIKLQEYEKELTESIQRQNDAKAGKNKLSYGSRILTAMETSGNPYDPNAGQAYMNRLKEKEIELNETIDKQETERQARIKEMIQEVTTGQQPVKKPFAPTAPTGDTKKAAEKEKEIRIKTFQDELDEKKGMYELYERWIQHVGKDAADEQFQELRKGGENYVDWLNREITRLEQLRDFQYAGFSDQDKTDLDRLLTERGQMQGQKTGIEAFREDLTRAKDEAESLIDFLQYLEAVQRGLDGDKSILGSEKRLATATEKLSTEKALKEDLRAFLQTVEGSEQKRAAIEAKYAQKRATLNKLVEDGKVIDHKKALAAIDAAEKKELEDDAEEVQKKSASYKAFLKIVEKHQSELKKSDIKAARELFTETTKNLDKESDLYKKHYADLIETEEKYRRKQIEGLYAVSEAAGQVGQVMQEIGGNFSGPGAVITAAANTIRGMTTALESLNKSDGKLDFKGAMDWVTMIVKAIGFAISGLKRMKADLKEYFDNYQQSLTDYALAQNQKIGDNHSQNPFMSDFNGMVQAGVNQYQDAIRQYQESIAKLEDGSALVGHKSGFWRSKKNKDVFADLLDTYPNLVDSAGNLNKELAQTLIATNQVDDATKTLLETSIAWADQVESANQQMMNTVVDLTGMIGNDLTDAMVNAFKAGENGAKAMSDVIGGVIESLVKETTLLEIFRPMMDELSAGVKESLSTGGDGSILDDLARLNGKLPDAYKIAEQIMSEMQNYGRANGMSIFEQAAGSMAGGSATKGYIQGVTEQTVSQLIGQSNAIRIYQGEMNNNMRISAAHLGGILENTRIANVHLSRLKYMESLLGDIRSTLKYSRGSGI